MKTFNDFAVLSNGVKIPCLGYGTWQSSKEDAEKCVKTAIDLGYRHIDTAYIYGNEDAVGRGIKASGISRNELFVTTKHWVTERGYEKTIRAVETSLSNLGMDYVDLYLIHWPCVEKASPEWKEINASTWRGFEKMYKDGKIRAIGLSNFEKNHIDALNEYAEIKPMVNQIEFHPGYIQAENVKYCKDNGIIVEAWSPLGCGRVLKDEKLAEIAAKYGKSTAQLCIRFALQNDVIPLPKSVTPERIKQNTEVFDFEISEEDMKAIASMPVIGFSGFAPENAPADALAK